MSLEECCKYCIRFSNELFSQDSTFPLVAFNLIARPRVATFTLICANINPAQFSVMAEVTREQLAPALSEQQKSVKMLSREKVLNSSPVTGPSEADRRAQCLLRSLRISHALMWGSSEERLVYRRRAFSVDAFLTSADVFVTITPADVETLGISVLSGSISAENAKRVTPNLQPSHAERVQIAECNPIACAEYFEQVCQASV